MAGCRRCPELALLLALCLAQAIAVARADDLSEGEASAEHLDQEEPRVRLSGFLQVDSVLLDQTSVDELDPATREPLNQERFVLQRAWLRADGGTKYVHGLVITEGTTSRGAALRLLAAELSVFYPAREQPPLLEVTLGLFLIPFGLETRELVPDRMFLEASTWVEALFPGRRDLGARVRGQWRFLRYALAAMNGNPIGGASLPTRDPNRAKDVLGRLGVDDALTSWLRVSAGVSAMLGKGFHAGAAPTKDSFVIRDVNEDGIAQPSEIQLVAGEPGEPSHNFDRRALGADLTVGYELPRLGRGRVYGELAWAVNADRGLFVADPVATGRDMRELGFMVAVRQALTRHVEAGLRYDHYEPDRDASSRRGVRIVPYDASFSTVGAAVAWCTLPRLRVTLQYDHRQNPLGRDRRGAPTTLAADSLILRAQLEL